MSTPEQKRTFPERHRTKSYLSLPALGFVLTCLLLAGVLGVVTWHDLDRERQFLQRFLSQQAQTLIRAFEAGARTSMTRTGGGNLAMLVKETAREKSIAYIVVVDTHGHLLASAWNLPESIKLPPAQRILGEEQPQTRFLTARSGQRIYEVAREFKPLSPIPKQMRMRQRWRDWCGMSCADAASDDIRQIIYLGLYTEEFDAARAEHLKQSLVLLGILLLLGSGGLYLLFLAHNSRVTRVALENMELYTDNVINSMPAGLISLDTERRIVSVNHMAKELLGRDQAVMRGRTLQQLFAPHDCVLTPLLRCATEFLDQPLDCPLPDGTTIPLKVSGSHLYDRDGALCGMVLILRDQREIRAMEEALNRSRRHAALGRMATGIAHEIRNPLGTLKGFAQYFARSSQDDKQSREYAELMIGEVDRLNRTVSALLQFSRPRDPERVPVEFPPLARKALTFVQAEADSQQIILDLDQRDTELSLHADPDLLQQVLLNLLQNSLAATAVGGRITLGMQSGDRSVQFWVEDSGEGLSSEEQGKMFDPFYTTRKEGTGLGLAVVQQIIEQHGGRIEVASAPGQGTRITVILPRGEESI